MRFFENYFEIFLLLQIWVQCVWYSCIPSFNLLLYLELVKKFSVVRWVGGWLVGGGVESNFSVHLWSKPKLPLGNKQKYESTNQKLFNWIFHFIKNTVMLQFRKSFGAYTIFWLAAVLPLKANSAIKMQSHRCTIEPAALISSLTVGN